MQRAGHSLRRAVDQPQQAGCRGSNPSAPTPPAPSTHLLPVAAQAGGQRAATSHRAQLAGQRLQGGARVAGEAACGCWRRHQCRRGGAVRRLCLGGGAGAQRELSLDRCEGGGGAHRRGSGAALLLQRLGRKAPAASGCSGRRQGSAAAAAAFKRRSQAVPWAPGGRSPACPATLPVSPAGGSGAGSRARLLGPEARS